MDWLGVRVEVDVSAVVDGVSCLIGGCEWRWDGLGDRDASIEEHRADEHAHIPAFKFSVRTDAGRAALEAMDDLFTQRELLGDVDQADDEPGDEDAVDESEDEPEPLLNPEPEQEVEVVRASRRPWTREECVAAIQAFHAEHGRPPTATEWIKASPDHPTNSTVIKYLGSWSGAIEAAGFEPRVRGGNKRSSTREPQGREPGVASSPSPPSPPPVADDDGVSDDSPGPKVGTNGAGSRVDGNYATWLAETVGIDALEDQIAVMEDQLDEIRRRQDALRSIVRLVRELEEPAA